MRQITLTLSLATALALGLAGRSALAQDGNEADPLLDIAADMNAAAMKLGKLKTDKPTQDSEQSALKKLDEIIARLEQERQQRGQGRVGRGKPAQESTIRQGPGGMGALHAERKEGKQWGELPPKERERILQSMNDGFPSHYQKILERYFARLADEKPLADSEQDSGTATAPAATPGGETKAPETKPAAETKPAPPAEDKEAK